ncbi:MAG TPA: Ig-like domain-containing protein [Solirubrobacteraceae bacterium]
MLVAAVAFLAVARASAASAALSIETPLDGSAINNPTPAFAGTTENGFAFGGDSFNPITVKVYAGETTTGPPAEEAQTPEFEGEKWSAQPTTPLAPGVYTAQAEQGRLGTVHSEQSAPVRFTVDLRAPSPTISSPVGGSSAGSSSQTVVGTAGGEAGDLATVTVQLFAGAGNTSQTPLESLIVQSSGGAWSADFAGLAAGSYTVRAQQEDRAGNIGSSAPVTFSLTAPQAPPHAPPVASFIWFPSVPRVGQTVTLVSSSVDNASPLTVFAWSQSATGAFTPGKASLKTAFAKPGNHTVRLQVRAADGLTSAVTHVIRVVRPRATLLQPFPIVRIAGSLTSSGVNIAVLTAQVPLGARVTVSCRGPGCPTGAESRLASVSTKRRLPATVVIAFRHFQRALRAGVTLQIRISKPGRIGKYTRFSILHGALPQRVDTCLQPAGYKPMGCPS